MCISVIYVDFLLFVCVSVVQIIKYSMVQFVVATQAFQFNKKNPYAHTFLILTSHVRVFELVRTKKIVFVTYAYYNVPIETASNLQIARSSSISICLFI